MALGRQQWSLKGAVGAFYEHTDGSLQVASIVLPLTSAVINFATARKLSVHHRMAVLLGEGMWLENKLENGDYSS